MHPAIPDAEISALLPRAQSGEAAAVEALYDLYADRLYRYLLARTGDSETAADLTTEVFFRGLKHIGRFQVQKDCPAASLSGWLYRIAANLAADYHRARRRRPETSLDEHEMTAGSDPDPLAVIEKREAAGRLAQAMEGLTEEQRIVVVGKFGEGMSNRQVAEWLGKSEGAVEALQHRALRALGRLLGVKKG